MLSLPCIQTPVKKALVAGVLAWLVAATAFGAAPAIIPRPQQLQVGTGVFTLCPAQPIAGRSGIASTKLLVDAASRETGQYLALVLFKSTGYRFLVATNSGLGAVEGAVVLTTNNALASLGSEGYELTVATNSVLIRAPAAAGVFYGVQSLLQLFPPEILAQRPVPNVTWTAPCVYIQDWPRFPWRGWMLDSVRHFFDKDEVKQALDAMALHKLNRFHWHLDDDAGWRIQILKYPLLTERGAWRRYILFGLNPRASTAWSDDGRYGGYYTQDDIREVVAYARQRQITVIPEIEMPGHSSAAINAYPQFACGCTTCSNAPSSIDITNSNPGGVFCAAKPETQEFLHDILTEVISLFPGPYIHIGGDEVNFSNWFKHTLDINLLNSLGLSSWQKYQSYFTQQNANWLRSQGRSMVGWSEIMNGGLVTNAVLMDWKTGSSSQAVFAATNRQYVVMSPSPTCYLNNIENSGVTWSVEPPFNSNTPQSLSTVYSFEPIPASLPSAYTNYILGAQGNAWCEYIPSMMNVQFKLYPRLCAIAELTWTAAALKNYTDFTNRFATHRQRLDQMGVNYNRSAVPPQVGAWNPAQVSTNYQAVDWDLTPYVMRNGEIDLSFCYKSGAHALNIQWAALLANGVELDRDTHPGYTGYTPNSPLFILRLPTFKAGTTYTLRASIAGAGGTDSSGVIFWPNWN